MDADETTVLHDVVVEPEHKPSRAERRGQGMVTMKMSGSYRSINGQFVRIAKLPEERTAEEAKARKAKRKRQAKARRR